MRVFRRFERFEAYERFKTFKEFERFGRFVQGSMFKVKCSMFVPCFWCTSPLVFQAVTRRPSPWFVAQVPRVASYNPKILRILIQTSKGLSGLRGMRGFIAAALVRLSASW